MPDTSLPVDEMTTDERKDLEQFISRARAKRLENRLDNTEKVEFLKESGEGDTKEDAGGILQG